MNQRFLPIASSRMNQPFPGLVCILLFGAAIRAAGLGVESVWFDEAISVRFASQPVRELLRSTAADTHPPLYYLMLKAWIGLFGAGEIAARSLSTLWSLIGIVLIYCAGRRAASAGNENKTGLLAAFMLAVNPLDVAFAQEIRMYEPAMALGLASTILLGGLLSGNQAAGPSGRAMAARFVIYALLVTCMIYTHPATVLIAVAQGIAALPILLRRKQHAKALFYLLSALFCAACFYPWILYVHNFRDADYFYIRTNLTAWMPVPRAADVYKLLADEFVWGHTTLDASRASIPRLASLRPLLAFLSAACVLAPIAAFGLCMAGRRRVLRWRPLLYYMWMTMAPVMLCFAVSRFWQPIYYRPRFSVFVLPCYIVVCAALFGAISKNRLRLLPPVIFAAVTFFGTLLQTASRDKKDIRSAARYCAATLPEGARLVFAPFFDRVTYEYYAGTGAPVITEREIREAQSNPLAPEIRMFDCGERDEDTDPRTLWLRSLRPRETVARFHRVRIDRITMNREIGTESNPSVANQESR